MENMLCLDLAKKTGWTVYSGQDYWQGGTFNLGGIDRGARLVTLFDWLKNKIAFFRIQRIAIEKPPYVNSTISYRHGCALATVVELVCRLAGIPLVEVEPKDIKKQATGNGNASKEDVIEACGLRLGVDVIDDNHADAIWLGQWCLEHVDWGE